MAKRKKTAPAPLSKRALHSKASKNQALLSCLCMCNAPQRKAVICKMSGRQVNDMTDLVEGFMKRRFPVSKDVVRNLKKDRKKIYAIANRNKSVRQRKQVLEQSGGFLPFLLGPILKTAVGGLVGTAANGLIKAVTGKK